MDSTKLNHLILETLSLGESIIDGNTIEEEQFNTYQFNINQIAEHGLSICKDKVQLQTCMIIKSKKVDNYRLSILERIFDTYSKGFNGKVNTKNSDLQIRKRYVVDLNRFLPILKVK